MKTNGSVTVKRHTLNFIGQRGNSSFSKEDGQEEMTSSNHIRVQEYED